MTEKTKNPGHQAIHAQENRRERKTSDRRPRTSRSVSHTALDVSEVVLNLLFSITTDMLLPLMGRTKLT
jgi:hypothetical protein